MRKRKRLNGSEDDIAKAKGMSKILNQYLNKKETKILPTSNSLVALNSSLPASRLTSVAAVLKVSSIPKDRQGSFPLGYMEKVPTPAPIN